MTAQHHVCDKLWPTSYPSWDNTILPTHGACNYGVPASCWESLLSQVSWLFHNWTSVGNSLDVNFDSVPICWILRTSCNSCELIFSRRRWKLLNVNVSFTHQIHACIQAEWGWGWGGGSSYKHQQCVFSAKSSIHLMWYCNHCSHMTLQCVYIYYLF